MMRARITGSLAWATCIFGFFAYVPSMFASFDGHRPEIAVADTIIYGWVVAVRLLPLTSAQRARHIVALLHLVGAMLLVAIGPFGHGLMWLLAATVVAGMLLGVRAAMWSVAVQAVLVAATSAALLMVSPAWWIADPKEGTFAWFAFAGSSLFLSVALSVPIAKLITTLEVALSSVDHDRARLADANARLLAEGQKRERLEAELRRARKLEAMGTVAGSIAHDFNNLLMPILALSSTARATVPEGSSAASDLDEVVGAAERARELVRQMTSYTRRDDIPRAPLSLGATLRSTMILLKASVPAKVTLQLEVADIDDTVLASVGEVQQVMLNLTTNAVHAMRERGGRISIRVLATDEAPVLAKDAGRGFIRLEVEDEGEGMDAATLERVFEPFFTTKPAGVGTGLGLATVHGIVTSMGGAISVTSAVGAGTTFHLVLPRAP